MELRNLWVQIYHTSDGLTFQTRSINKFKKVNNCITGSELVEWLIKKKSHSKDQAIVIGQALLHGKWLECAYQNNQNNSQLNTISNYYQNAKNENTQIFYDDNTFYKPGSTALNCHRNENIIMEKKKALQYSEEGPDWIKELNKLVSNIDEEKNAENEKTTKTVHDIDQNLDKKSIVSNNSQNSDDSNANQYVEPINLPLVKSTFLFDQTFDIFS